jgi:hypothetical protein
VFALAPGDTVADIAAAAAAETLIERPDDTEGGSRVYVENGVWGRTHAGTPFGKCIGDSCGVHRVGLVGDGDCGV